MRFITILSYIFFSCTPLYSQSNEIKSDTTITLNDLVISSEKNGAFRPLVRVISVIEAKEIEKKPVNNLPDLFRYLLGVDYKTRGSEGVQGDINILGGTFDETIVLVNGINVTDPQTGHHSMNIPVEINQIERIEVLQGPGAWVGGTIAYSGAINIITKEAKNNCADLFISGGSYGYLKAGVSASITRELNRWSMEGISSGTYSRSDGFSDNTDFKIGNLYVNLKFIDSSKKNSFTIQSGVQTKSYGANSFYSFTYPQQFEKVKTMLSSIQYQHNANNWQLSLSLYHRRLYDKFELFRYEAPQWYLGHNYHRNDVSGVEVKVGLKIKKAGTLITGADIRIENIISNVLGNSMDKIIDVQGEEDVFYTKSKNRYTPAVFIKHLIQFEKWRFSSGVTYSNSFNENSFSGSYGAGLYGGLAGAYSITPNIELNFWLNNSYRNPTFTDLYYKSPSQTGNIELKPEKAASAQLGIRYFKARTKIYYSGFYRKGYRIIDWIRESGSQEWHSSNITNINSSGFEFSLCQNINNKFITDAVFSYSFLNVQKNSGDYHSLYATDYLRHKVSLNFDHTILKKLTANWSLNYQERAGTFIDLALNEQDYKPFTLINVKLLWNRNSSKLFFEVSNLLNKKYFDLGNLTQPGRWIKSGLIINL